MCRLPCLHVVVIFFSSPSLSSPIIANRRASSLSHRRQPCYLLLRSLSPTSSPPTIAFSDHHPPESFVSLTLPSSSTSPSPIIVDHHFIFLSSYRPPLSPTLGVESFVSLVFSSCHCVPRVTDFDMVFFLIINRRHLRLLEWRALSLFLSPVVIVSHDVSAFDIVNLITSPSDLTYLPFTLFFFFLP